jgi:predicted house-cleaning noncanonical NTP pyrophosphatase (MazG superfamily)
MIAGHESPTYHQLNDHDYLSELQRKILEEAGELNVSSPEAILAELADVQECIDAMLSIIGRTRPELEAKQKQKRDQYGGFDGRIYLDTVQKTVNDPWLSHLLANPDRYPEIT